MESKEQTNQRIRYNRVLLHEIPREFRRLYEFRPGEEDYVTDFSSLQFLIEEFIALSATKIAIPKGSQIEQAIKYLHPILKKEIVLVDKKQQSFKKYGAILAPIQKEFGVRLSPTDHPGIIDLIIERADVSDELRMALINLFFNLRTFILGIENELQIKIDLNMMQRATDIVRINTENPEARLMLASLFGLFNTYEQHNITSLGITSTYYKENLEKFEKLIDDQIYKNMSQQSHSLGFPAKLKKSKTTLKQLTKQILTKSPYKQIAKISTKIISAVTHFPFEIEWISSFFKKPYMPPIITFDRAIQKAQEALESADRPVIGTYKGYFPEEEFLKDLEKS